ncbi:MAG TPA: hypothetical protein DDW54_00110, partial [Clostridiales bacterium]|nr:hypothetical protein [Clostridiales bacterium]
MSKQSRDTNIIDNTITDYLKPHSAKRVSKRGKNKKIPVTPEMRFYPDPKEGLDEEQVETRIGQRQINEKGKQYSKSVARIITSNLFTFFNLLCVLCVVALVAVKAALLNFTFVITYVLNLSISIFQEIRAKKAIEKLSILNEPTASVIRKGSTKEISVNDIVLDDIVKYSIGNQLSIDGTVVEGSIEVNESMLTGEAVPVKKNVGDKVFAGSYVVSGTSLVMADKVGEDRYIQTLSAKAKKFKKPSSELMTTLKWIIRVIGVLIIPMAIFVFLTNRGVVIATHPDVTTLSSGEMTEVVTKTTSVILGMIPSGMFLLTTLALAVGVVRLANRQTSVQDMYALEMLARVDVLCLDKTGTITDGRMKVSNCVLFNSSYKYDVKDIVSSMQNALSDNNQTAIALKKYFGTDNKLIATQIIPFSSSRKYSAVSFNDKGKEIGTFAIGAPEFILSRKVMPKYLTDQIRHYSSLGQRVLLLAMSEKSITGENIPADMKPFALITLSDNIRRDAIKAISWFRKNDVKVKVISGDNPMTVAEVAKRAGIEGADQFISLEGMTEREVIDVADKYNVFGRVTPEQKAVLVKAMKRAGHTVAMTGDGVND